MDNTPQTKPLTNWHELSIKEIQKKLSTDLKKGLTTKEFGKRKKSYGANELPRGKEIKWYQRFFNQFKNPLVFILLIAAAFTFFIQHYIDTTVILLAVFINVLIGFIQENRSNQIFKKLKSIIPVKARVLRNGRIIEVDSAELVPGDIINITTGIKISADARIISEDELEVNEALLTGESNPVNKHTDVLSGKIALADRKNMVYTGTVVEKGEAIAVVVETGSHTEIGKIAALTQGVEEETTPLQERLARLSKIISIAVLFATILIVVIGFFQPDRSIVEMIKIAITVAVAAIPEGLPAALSVVLAVASQRILRKKGLVKNLIGAETLGSTTVICTDKTGTLTEGKMEVRKILESKNNEESLRALGFANEAILVEEGKKKNVFGEGTDVAKLQYFIEKGNDIEKELKKYPRKAILPFDDDSKYVASFHDMGDGTHKLYVTGAPEQLLEVTNVKKANKDKIIKTIEKEASDGFRMIGIACKTIKDTSKINYKDRKSLRAHVTKLTFAGMAVLRDPIRDDVIESIKQVRGAGVRIIMVTGDHKLTARAIGDDLGFQTHGNAILSGHDVDALSDSELSKKIRTVELFYRVSPRHKMRLVNALKESDEVVAMTGDGVNDAPALKAADIGIALGSGTDVTKEAADLVLIDNSFSVIVEAIREGRVAFGNIRKVVVFLNTNSFTELIVVIASLILHVPLPITAVQILWANLVEDGLPNFALAFEPGEKEVMHRKPYKRGEHILDTQGLIFIFVIGVINDILLVGAFMWLYFNTELPLIHIQTIIFTVLATNSLFYVFSIKSLHSSLIHTNLLNNRFLLVAVGVGLLIMAASIYVPILNTFLGTVPLGGFDLILIGALVVFEILMIEFTKFIFRRREARALRTA